MFLLDTNVISELRRVKPHGAVLSWIQSKKDSELYVSAVSIGELQAGAEKTRKQDSQKAQEIDRWIDQLQTSFQLLDMDAQTFREWGRLMQGRPESLTEDAMIAATSRVRRLTVATRNTRDFRVFDVPLINPFE